MRLFIAVGANDELRRAAIAVRRAVEGRLSELRTTAPRLVWVAPASLHVTLRFLGEQPDDRVSDLVAAVTRPFPHEPFTLAWHGLGAFPSPRRPRALWLGVSRGARELGAIESELARRLGDLLPGEALATTPAAFHPHLTLARVKTDVPGVDWPDILSSAAPPDVVSLVNRVSLMRSHGRPGGEGYESLGHGLLVGTQ